MNTTFKKLLRIVAAIALPSIATIATVTTASAQTQQNNQLAIQLGAIQLGYSISDISTNAQLLANALIQGQQALLATTTNKYATYVGTNSASTNQPVAQSTNFRAQLNQATINALTSPVTNTNKYTGVNTISVLVYNPKNGSVTTKKITSFGLNPALTTPTAVLALVSARVPNFDPGLISNAVAATMMFTTNSNGVVFPVWGPQPAKGSVTGATTPQKVLTLNEKTVTTQLNNSAAVAKAALTAAVKAYTAGTKQWATFKASTGPTNGVTYLPNFSAKALGPTGNPQVQDLTGLADAAAAVAASAMSGLGAINTNSTQTEEGLYGQTAVNVQKIATALTQAAAAVQATSVKVITNIPNYSSGALGAESLGLITQVAGISNDNWGGQASTGLTAILNGVVRGAVTGVGKTSPNVSALVSGISQGFYATYLATYNGEGTPDDVATFLGLNGSAIATAFTNAGVTKITPASYSTLINSAFTQVFNAATTGGAVMTDPSTWNYNGTTDSAGYPIPGARGVNYFSYLNGVGTPVTDTTGL